MKKLRKILAIYLSTVLILSLVACGAEENVSTTTSETEYNSKVDNVTTNDSGTTEETNTTVQEDTTTKENASLEETTVDIETSLEDVTTKEVVTTEKQTTKEKQTTEKQITTEKETTKEKQTTTEKETTKEKQTTTQKETTENATTKVLETETTSEMQSYADKQRKLEDNDIQIIKEVYEAVQVAYLDEKGYVDANEINQLFSAMTLNELLNVKDNVFVQLLNENLEGANPCDLIFSDSAKANKGEIYIAAKGKDIGVWIGNEYEANISEYRFSNQYYEVGKIKAEDIDAIKGVRYEVTLTVAGDENMTDPYRGDWLKSLCEIFQEQHPEWRIVWNFVTLSSGGNMIENIGDKVLPDIYFYPSDELDELVEIGYLLPYGTATMKYIKEICSTQLIDSVNYNGNIYGIPYTTNNWYMYYDKSVFKNVDITSLDAMLEVGNVAFPIDHSWYIQAFFLATGCSFAENKFDFGGAKGEEALQYMVDKINSGKLIPLEATRGDIMSLESNVSAFMGASWSAENVKEYFGDNYGVASIPKINVTNGDGQLRCMSTSKAIGVNPNSEYLDVAVELAKFLASEIAQDALYEGTGIIPANTKLLLQDEYKMNELVIAQNETFNNCSILQPEFLTGTGYDWWSISVELGDEIKAGTITDIKARVAEFNRALNESLTQ